MTVNDMNMKKGPFWKTKTLKELTNDEWESLCDGCGICCLEKLEDKKTGEIRLISISCQFLDTTDCRCMIYDHRMFLNPDCLKLSLDNLTQIRWLPQTCAYRCVHEGRELEWWHPLVSGDPNTIHQAGISIRDRVVSGQYVHHEDILRLKER